MRLHTLLGAGGAIANQLVPILLAKNEKVRLVSRSPRDVGSVESLAADVMDPAQLMPVIKGSDVVYLLVGLKYDVRVWRESWPRIMTNTINACQEAGARLIFFDNVYMYGRVDGPMTEETPFNPCSRKGLIRAEIATTLLSAMHSQGLNALIARSADFYGPGAARTGVPNLLVFENLKKGRKAQWLGNADAPHSYTYVPDAAAALYLLANTPKTFGRTWHLPTAPHPLTGRRFINEAAKAMQRAPSFRTINTTMLRLAGLFDRTIGELAEMNYQNTAPYVFNSDKFNRMFNYTPRSYVDGIRETAKEYRTQTSK